MNTSALTNGTSHLDELEQQADAARARLLEVVDTLDARRHALKGEGETRILKMPLHVMVPAGAAALGAGALLASVLVSKRNARRASRRKVSPLASLLAVTSMVILSHVVVESGRVAFKKLTHRSRSHRSRMR